MKEVRYKPQGVCSKEICFSLDDNGCIHNLQFAGGCNGNLKAIGKLLEGEMATKAIERLKGNTCGFRNTSCADQLSKALEENI